jgi:SAM-dependent methyltransferase
MVLFPDDVTVSRYVRPTDPQQRRVVYHLPGTWWSRGYEYAWAGSFAEPEHVVLDAGAGIPHPFKLWLTHHCRAVHAIDLDPRILSPDAIVEAIRLDAGEEAVRDALPLISLVERRVGSLTALPYADNTFDTVFCISTWEHLWRDEQAQAVAEMARTLKPGGRLILTTDVPPAEPAFLQFCARQADLTFLGPVDFHQSPETIFETPWGPLSCFRAALVRRTA